MFVGITRKYSVALVSTRWHSWFGAGKASGFQVTCSCHVNIMDIMAICLSYHPALCFNQLYKPCGFRWCSFAFSFFFSSCSSFHDNSKNFKNKSRSSMKFHEIPWNSWTLDSCHSPHSEERTQGPIRYNVATGKLTFGDYHYKPDAEGSLEFKVLAASSIWYLISDI